MDPQEYFARAVESTHIDGTDAGGDTPPGGYADLADELTVVARLRDLGADPRDENHGDGAGSTWDKGDEDTAGHGPDTAERERMRQRIFSGLSTAPEAESATRPPTANRSRSRSPSRQGRSPLRDRSRMHSRFSHAMAAAVCLLIVLSGSSLLFAGEALPGDSLYGIKRTMEHAHVALSIGEKSTGFTHLELATNRIREIEQLADRDGTVPAEDYIAALHAFDADAATGSRALTDVGTNAAASTLTSLRSWSSEKYRRLNAVRSQLPPRTAAASTASLTLLDRIVARVDALRGRFACRSITSGEHDDLGPLAATGACRYSPRTVDPYASTGPLPPARPKDHGRQETPDRQAVLAAAHPDVPDAPAAPAPSPRSPSQSPPTTAPPPTSSGDGDGGNRNGGGASTDEDTPSVDVPLPADLGSVEVPGLLSIGLG